jgi:hypothetical protein
VRRYAIINNDTIENIIIVFDGYQGSGLYCDELTYDVNIGYTKNDIGIFVDPTPPDEEVYIEPKHITDDMLEEILKNLE